MRSRRHLLGFTLIEVMVVVVVLAIFASLAAPSFSASIDRARLRSQVVAIVDVLQFAKSEAMKRSNVTVTITGSTQGNNNWSVVAAAVDPANVSQQRQAAFDVANGVTLPTSDAVLVLDFRGLASPANLTVQSALGQQVRIAMNSIGGLSVCSVGTSILGYPSC